MKNPAPDLKVNARDYFIEAVDLAIESRSVSTIPQARLYLADLLNNYITTTNLIAAEMADSSGRRLTLAEMWFKANMADLPKKNDLLKQLGDSTLYISGFFGDSLRRKLVDVDYYAGIGGSAYGSLAQFTPEGDKARVYEEFSGRFLEFVDVLTFISQKVLVQSNEDLLRLYERYISTGSALARDQLLEKGLLTHPSIKSSKAKQ